VVAVPFKKPALVTRWLPGGDVPLEHMRTPGVMAQVAAMLRRLHSTPALPSAFAIFRLIEQQRPLADALPDSYDRLLDLLHRIEDAARGPEHDPVSCHNDLLTANFVRDGGRVCIVDWEYAGMNDRYFDLGNLSVNNGFNEAGDEWLLECYWGEPCTRRRLATLRLMRIMSDLREAMWGVVQQVISELDFDFGEYAQEHFERVRAGFSDPRFGVWLEDARRGA